MRWSVPLIAAILCGCVTLTPEGSRVSVYQARMNAAPADRSMPAGCTLIAAEPAKHMTELDLDGQKDPFRKARNEAGAAGANALLVLRRTLIGRRDPECAAAMRITDCAGSLGAWFDVTVESYTCPSDALANFSLPSPIPDIGVIKNQ
jgi:hypothetical protein